MYGRHRRKYSYTLYNEPTHDSNPCTHMYSVSTIHKTAPMTKNLPMTLNLPPVRSCATTMIPSSLGRTGNLHANPTHSHQICLSVFKNRFSLSSRVASRPSIALVLSASLIWYDGVNAPCQEQEKRRVSKPRSPCKGASFCHWDKNSFDGFCTSERPARLACSSLYSVVCSHACMYMYVQV